MLEYTIMVTTTTNCVEYLLELDGKLEFIWDIFSELSLHHYNYDIINMYACFFLHEKHLSD